MVGHPHVRAYHPTIDEYRVVLFPPICFQLPCEVSFAPDNSERSRGTKLVHQIAWQYPTFESTLNRLLVSLGNYTVRNRKSYSLASSSAGASSAGASSATASSATASSAAASSAGSGSSKEGNASGGGAVGLLAETRANASA